MFASGTDDGSYYRDSAGKSAGPCGVCVYHLASYACIRHIVVVAQKNMTQSSPRTERIHDFRRKVKESGELDGGSNQTRMPKKLQVTRRITET